MSAREPEQHPVRPFTIDVPQADLDDLHRRIDATRWPEAEPVDDWSQGTPLSYARELAEHWRHHYDWRAREAALNRFDHVLVDVGAGDGADRHDLTVHAIHQRSPHDDAFPLLITHGWPGSIVEFHQIIEPLTDPTAHGGRAEDAFHVVCPSLPGYGFSAKPATTGWGVERIGKAWADLMATLGYDRYGAQGGDWGAAVTSQVGRDAGPDAGASANGCVAIHLNMPLGRPPAGTSENPTDADKVAFAGAQHYQQWDSGYSKQQSTRPQTLGYGLVDSPVGQMAWIVEKFWAWTDCDGHPENALSKDEMLDNIMLYWLNGAGASSARLYWESFGNMAGDGRVEVPTGVASFPKEIVRTPRSWCEDRYRITHWTDMPRGGHFAAFEQPELFVDDLRTFFGTVR